MHFAKLPAIRLAAAASIVTACAARAPLTPAPPAPPAPVAEGPPRKLQVAGPALQVAGPALQVAGPALDEPPSRRVVVVDARVPRTPIGHVKAGERVRISVLDAAWNHDPSAPMFDAAGAPGARCMSSGGHACIGGDGAAPLMGLILLTATFDSAPFDPAPFDPAPAPSCGVFFRHAIPTGVEFAAPEEADVFLAPNDWEDGLFNNTGAVQVEVELAAAARSLARWRRAVAVDARSARTPIGHFKPGEYLRVSVVGGRWSHGAGAPLVGPAGLAGEPCRSAGEHACIAGDGAAPRMALVLVMTSCASGAEVRAPALQRRYIPTGVDLVAPRESDLFLAPNDWEDGLDNNAGSARVAVETWPVDEAPR